MDTDDNSNGWTDEGWDGLDNNGNGQVDELAEWEAELWPTQIVAQGVQNQTYAIERRPAPRAMRAKWRCRPRSSST